MTTNNFPSANHDEANNLPPSLSDAPPLTGQVPYEREQVPPLLEWPSDKLVPLSSLPPAEHATPPLGKANYGRTRQRMKSVRKIRTAAVTFIAGAAVLTLLVHINPLNVLSHLPTKKTPVPVGSVHGAQTGQPTVAPVTATFTPATTLSPQKPAIATPQSMHATQPATPSPTQDVCVGGSSFSTECAWSVTTTSEPYIVLTVSPTSPIAYTATIETISGTIMDHYTSMRDPIQIRIDNPPAELFVIITPTTPPPHEFTLSAS